MTDFIVRNEGTIVLLRPVSAAAKAWAQYHLPSDAVGWGDSIVIEHRYFGDILNGITADGLGVEAA